MNEITKINEKASSSIERHHEMIQKVNNGRNSMIFPPNAAIPDEGEFVGDKKPGYATMTLTKKQSKIWNDQVLNEVSYYQEINTVYLLTEFNIRFMRLLRNRLRLMLLYLPRDCQLFVRLPTSLSQVSRRDAVGWRVSLPFWILRHLVLIRFEYLP
jgi:hypothetical protein